MEIPYESNNLLTRYNDWQWLICHVDRSNNVLYLSRAAKLCNTSSLISPPLFKPGAALAMVPGYPHESGPGGPGTSGTSNNNDTAAGHSQDDEWKNIKVVSLIR